MSNSELSFEGSNSNDDMSGVDDFWSGYGFYHQSSYEKSSPLPYNDHEYFSQLTGMDDMHFDIVSAAYKLVEKPNSYEEDPEKSLESEICELLGPREMARTASFPYFEILNNDLPSYCSNEEQANEQMDEEAYQVQGGKLSTEEIMRIAAAHYIQLSNDRDGESSHIMHSCDGLSDEETKNLELASLLLAATEKASNQLYDQSSNLLRQCHALSSSTGNTVQRVVYYFSEALQERIDRETGRLSKGPKETPVLAEDVIKAMRTSDPIQLVAHRKLPFSQLLMFTSVQTILENVDLATRIHVIDLSIKHGVQWTILMQALATRSNPIEYLKISAVGWSEEAISATGKRLLDFAESLNLELDFKAVIIPDIKDLKEDHFELEDDETVTLCSAFDVNTFLVRPECLENLMKVIRRLKPCIMTVVDVEANHNSPSFINRFTESLFYFSALFDCIGSCMDGDDEYRMFFEGHDFSLGIRSIVATEGDERIVRHVGIGVWRSFFARFGLLEVELSEWSQYQANLLLVKQFPKASSCTLGKNGKSLTVDWKGTPLHFISAWRFS